MCNKRDKWVSGEGLSGGKTVEVDNRRERERDVSNTVKQNDHKMTDGRRQSGQQENGKQVTQQKRKDSIIRKVDKVVNRGEDITVCIPVAKIEDVADKAGQVMGGGTGGAVLVHVGTSLTEKEGTSAIVVKYRRLVKPLRGINRTDCVVGILPEMRGSGQE